MYFSQGILIFGFPWNSGGRAFQLPESFLPPESLSLLRPVGLGSRVSERLSFLVQLSLLRERYSLLIEATAEEPLGNDRVGTWGLDLPSLLCLTITVLKTELWHKFLFYLKSIYFCNWLMLFLFKERDNLILHQLCCNSNCAEMSGWCSSCLQYTSVLSMSMLSGLFTTMIQGIQDPSFFAPLPSPIHSLLPLHCPFCYPC